MPVADCVEIREYSAGDLGAYSRVSIAFRVTSRLVFGPEPSALVPVEEPVEPYHKDYDAFPGDEPLAWLERWELSNWGFFGAMLGEQWVGAAAVAWNTPGVQMLQGRSDLAVLWDLRVHPDHRGAGIGHQLFAAAADWARARGCRELCIETQNVNVPACRFYARQGCTLGAINRHAYPELPEEVQLLWYRALV